MGYSPSSVHQMPFYLRTRMYLNLLRLMFADSDLPGPVSDGRCQCTVSQIMINMVICWRAKQLSVCSGTAKGAYGNSPEGVGLSPELLVHPSNPIGGQGSLLSLGPRRPAPRTAVL